MESWPAALASILSAKPQTDHPWPAALASILSAKQPDIESVNTKDFIHRAA